MSNIKIGDRVRITGHPNARADEWVGLEGVAETVSSNGDIWVLPSSDRPDRYGTAGFYWTSEGLELVEQDEPLADWEKELAKEADEAHAEAIEVDIVNHPNHYTHGSIEVLDAIDDWGLNYRTGQVIKYVARHEHKDNPLQDLKKARFYLDREIRIREEALASQTTESQEATAA